MGYKTLLLLALVCFTELANSAPHSVPKAVEPYHQRVVDQLVITVLPDGGISFRHPFKEGMTYFAVHFNIEEPLDGLNLGQYNPDTFQMTDNYWEVIDARDHTFVTGERVYYWSYAVQDGVGYSDVENLFVVPGREKDPNNVNQCTSYPCLIFEDNFDTFDLHRWEHEITAGGGGNGEFQYYTNNRTNSYVKNGALHLKPTIAKNAQENIDWPFYGTLDLWGAGKADLCTGNKWNGCQKSAWDGHVVNPIQSARVRTSRSFSFKYGRLEVEAKLPRGDWIWPAIWLMSTDQYYGSWPASGEIDLMEGRGNAEYYSGSDNVGTAQVGQTLHWGPWWPENAYHLTTSGTKLDDGSNFADRFHKFRMDWSEDGIQLFVDDVLRMNSPSGDGYWNKGGWDQKFGDRVENVWSQGSRAAPFDSEFHIIMNSAVGGTGGYFHDHIVNAAYPKPWSDGSSWAMNDFWNARNLWLPTWPDNDDRALQINYVKVWKLEP